MALTAWLQCRPARFVKVCTRCVVRPLTCGMFKSPQATHARPVDGAL